MILADNTIFPGVVGNGMSWLVGFLGVSWLALSDFGQLLTLFSPVVWSLPTTTPVPLSTS